MPYNTRRRSSSAHRQSQENAAEQPADSTATPRRGRKRSTPTTQRFTKQKTASSSLQNSAKNTPLSGRNDDPQSRLKVTINEWRSVALWKWMANDDACSVCRNAFDACCAECKVPGDDCPLVWGVCSHCFHMHCIVKWLESQTGQNAQLCPMCRQEWKFAMENAKKRNSQAENLTPLASL